MYSFLKLTNLIIHYELGNYDILTNLIRQAEYFLVKHSRRYGVESELIQFFKIILKTTMFEKEKQYQKLILKLEELAFDPNEQMQINFLKQANWPYRNMIL